MCAVVEAADNSALPAVPTTPARPGSERVRFADFPRDSEGTSDHNHRAWQRGPLRPSCSSTDQVSQVLVRSLITAGVAPVVGILGSTFDRSKYVYVAALRHRCCSLLLATDTASREIDSADALAVHFRQIGRGWTGPVCWSNNPGATNNRRPPPATAHWFSSQQLPTNLAKNHVYCNISLN